MSRMDLVSYFLRIHCYQLSKEEKILLEARLFILVSRELCEMFKQQYKYYLRLINHQEHDMFSVNFVQEVIKDILSTDEYSLSGIAVHTHIPEEVLADIASGINAHPTFESSRKLFELHMIVRRELYSNILNKILSGYFAPKTPPEDDEHS